MQYSLILSIGRTFVRINCYVCRRVIMKYLLCILSLAFLLVGVGLFSNEEDLQGFREETGVPVLCDVSPTIEVKVRFDHPHQWGDDLYNDVWAWGRKIDEFGTLHHLQLLEDKPDFQIMTVVFGEPISRIDRSVFEDVATWGVCSLQGWVNSYESVRFVAIDDHTAIITGEYNMEQVKVWLEKYTSIKSLKTS